MSAGREVQCELCPKMCRIADGQAGDCRVRINRAGRLIAATFERPCALHVDPIEKKPLFHFLPASRAFSIATVGCNLHCRNCQNWQISQADPLGEVPSQHISCAQVVDMATQAQCRSIAYTYTDPVAFYEYTIETGALAHRSGIRNILVSAGYINPKPLRALCAIADAANIDLKFIDDNLYRNVCDARLKPVQEALVIFRQENVWLEVTNLLIPTLNADADSVRRLCQWIVAELGVDVPLHFSRFFPTYRMRRLPPTPESSLLRARDIARECGIRFAYIGNMPSAHGEDTICPHDGAVLVRRQGYRVVENNLTGQGACPQCGKPVAGVWR